MHLDGEWILNHRYTHRREDKGGETLKIHAFLSLNYALKTLHQQKSVKIELVPYKKNHIKKY